MPRSEEIAKAMAEMDRFNQQPRATVIEERYEKRVASVGGSYGGLAELMSQGRPGNWASDHKAEAEKYSGWHYVAISAIGKAIRSCDVEAYQEPVREYSKAYNAEDDDSVPLPKWHPLMKILKRPSASQSGASFREEVAIQLCLTGSALIWNVPNQMGRTVERYIIPTAIAEPRQPEKGLPKGGWYINPEVARWQVENGWFLYTGLAQAIGKIIDARDVQVIRFIHPTFKDEGQSPVSAGALWTDTSEKIDVSRHAHLRNGSDPSVIIGIDGVEDESTLQRMSAKFNEKYAGPSKHGKAMFVNGQNVKVEPVTRTPAEMAYEGAFAQFRDAIMALHGVTPIAAGIEAPSGDDGLYAPLKQFISGTVQPILDLMAEEDTEQLASQFGEGLTVFYTARSIDDAKLTEQQINTDIAAGAIEVDEIRKLRGRKPWGGEKGKAVAGQGPKQEGPGGLPGLPQGVPGLDAPKPPAGPQASAPGQPAQPAKTPEQIAEEAVAKALAAFEDRISVLLKSGDNCGTGAGGFKPGNDCAGGEGGEKPAKKRRGKKVTEESTGPKIEVFERGTGDFKFTPNGELIRGMLGDIPLTQGETGLIEKLSKKTKAGIESAMTDTELREDMEAGGINSINVESTSYYAKKTGRKGGWTAAYSNGALHINPKTAEVLEKETIPERKEGGLKRVISHEAGHGVWDRARDQDKKAFAEALKKNPELTNYVSRVVNVASNPNAFNDTGSRLVTESFAEVHALRRYNREMYDSLPEDIRSPIESARKFGLELSERRAGWADRLKPKWQKSGSDCGANGPGGGGFQAGNSCASGDGAGASSGEVNSKVQGWAKKKFKDEKVAENFARWFGGSKVVDEGGNPLTVYHGTSTGFTEFRNTGARLPSIGYGFYFSPDADVASTYATGETPQVMQVYLQADKVLDWDNLSKSDREAVENRLVGIVPDDRLAGFGSPQQRTFSREQDDEAEAFYRKKKKETAHLYHDRAKARVDFTEDGTVISWMEPGLGSATDSNLRTLAQEYDMQIGESLGYDAVRSGLEIVVFRPNQIKSATGNSGTFDPDNPNITKSASACGANAEGGGGFQPGNSCGKRDGSAGESQGGEARKVNAKVLAWAKEKFGDEKVAENFARWFGDSKVVDDDGNPLVVYRGESTGGDFNEFNREKTRENSFFFTADKEIASKYASDKQPREFYLSSERFIDLTQGKQGEEFIREWAKVYDDEGWIDRETGEEIDPVEFVQSGRLFDYEGDWSGNRWKDLQATIEADGYQGARLPDYDNDSGLFSAIVVFKPTSIKLATGNSGTFDPSNPNIYKSGSDCGANAEGGGGFQPGNSCGAERGSGSPSSDWKVVNEDELDTFLDSLSHNELDEDETFSDAVREKIPDYSADSHDNFLTGYKVDVTVKHGHGGQKGVREKGPHEFYFYADNEPVGFARATKNGKDVSFSMIGIMPEYQGKGYGTDVYEAFLDEGYNIVSDSQQTGATQAIYRKLAKKYGAEVKGDKIRIKGVSKGENAKSLGAKIKQKAKSGSSCGANAEGGGGFQPGNTCGREDGAESGSDSEKILSWAKEKFKDEETAKNFAEWFKGSKVVDEKGEPLVFYHGTTGKFENVFDPAKGELGNHFGTQEVADGFASRFNESGKGNRVYPAFLSIKNPLKMVDQGQWDNLQVLEALVANGKMTQKEADDWQSGFQERWSAHNWKSGPYPRQQETVNLLSSHGYDGIEYINRREGIKLPKDLSENTSRLNRLSDNEFLERVPNATTSYISIYPNQIKSATGNSGAFSPDSSDITKSSGCGANAQGGGGFQPGNTCGREDGAESGGEGKADAKDKKKQKQTEKEIGKWVQLGTELKRETGWTTQKLMEETEKQGDRKAQIKWMQSELDYRRDGEFHEARKKVQPQLDKVREKIASVWSKESEKLQALTSKEAEARQEWDRLSSERGRKILERHEAETKNLESPSPENQKKIDELKVQIEESKVKSDAAGKAWGKASEERYQAEKKARLQVAAVLRTESDQIAAEIAPQISVEGYRKDYLEKMKNGTFIEIGSEEAADQGSQKIPRDEASDFLANSVNVAIHGKALSAGVGYELGARPHAEPFTDDAKFGSLVLSGVSQSEARAQSINPGSMTFGYGESASTYLHEYAHQIEFGSREARDFAASFLEHRKGFEEPKSFIEIFPNSGYDEKERGIEDNFAEAFKVTGDLAADGSWSDPRRRAYYTGKIYGNNFTETLSMGVELLYKNPKAFAEADPEWFDLVTGVMTGRLLVGTQETMRTRNQ
jgi:phage portal protein BeeE